MCTITKKSESTQCESSTSSQWKVQGAVIASLIQKPLPAPIINRISSFTLSNELIHTVRPVCKRYQQLPKILDFKNSSITDKDFIEIINKNSESITCINLSIA